jgi:inhibitor of cysteine peptidase
MKKFNLLKILCLGLILGLGINLSFADVEKSKTTGQNSNIRSGPNKSSQNKSNVKSTNFAVQKSNAKNKIVFTDPLKTIMVTRTNPQFDIILKSNPNTGYSWVLKSYDNNLIAPVRQRFYNSDNKLLIGASGYEKWTFRVKPTAFTVPHLTSINLIYVRPWDDQGAQVLNFKVVTTNANKTT